MTDRWYFLPKDSEPLGINADGELLCGTEDGIEPAVDISRSVTFSYFDEDEA